MASRSVAILCIALASCLAVPAATAVATNPGAGLGAGGNSLSADAGQTGNSLIPDVQEGPDPDATVTRIETESDGTANWSVTIRMRLDSNESVEEFEAFREEFETNRSTYLGRFRDRMTGVVENADSVTERGMNATRFESEIGIQEVPRRWGYVTYRFRWEGFAAVEDGDIAVGDVFRGGLFLEAGDILILEAPAAYSVESADPTPDTTDGGALQWNGPESFEDQRPRAVFSSSEEPNSDTDTSTTDGDTDGDGPESSGLPPFAIVAGVVAIGLVAGGAAYLRRSGGAPGSSEPASGAETPAAATPGGTPATDSDGKPGAGTAAAGEGALGLDELATDEDRVLALLEAEGGRIRQAEIADRLDWSASKTSRVVSGMAEDGEIEKLRIGRENVIDLGSEDGETDGA